MTATLQPLDLCDQRLDATCQARMRHCEADIQLFLGFADGVEKRRLSRTHSALFAAMTSSVGYSRTISALLSPMSVSEKSLSKSAKPPTLQRLWCAS